MSTNQSAPTDLAPLVFRVFALAKMLTISEPSAENTDCSGPDEKTQPGETGVEFPVSVDA